MVADDLEREVRLRMSPPAVFSQNLGMGERSVFLHLLSQFRNVGVGIVKYDGHIFPPGPVMSGSSETLYTTSPDLGCSPVHTDLGVSPIEHNETDF